MIDCYSLQSWSWFANIKHDAENWSDGKGNMMIFQYSHIYTHLRQIPNFSLVHPFPDFKPRFVSYLVFSFSNYLVFSFHNFAVQLWCQADQTDGSVTRVVYTWNPAFVQCHDNRARLVFRYSAVPLTGIIKEWGPKKSLRQQMHRISSSRKV